MPPDPHSDSPGGDAHRDPRPDHDPHRADRAGDKKLPGGSGQFAAGGSLDAAMPGPGLATALGCARVGLGVLSDDALAGFLGGCQKIAAWSAGMLLEGIAEYASRRPDDRTPGRAARHAAAAKAARAALTAGEPADPPGYDEFAPDELMPVLRLSKGGASRQVELAIALRYRLRPTLAAMLDGQIDIVRARIIAEATAELTAADAAAVEALVLAGAGRQTYVALGMAVGKAVLRVDPQGTIRRRKRAEKRARVERWREYDGTGALAGRNLPPDDTLAADQALTARALELRAAGLDGPLDYLRATALIDQITGRDSRPRPGQDEHALDERGAGAADQEDEEEDWDDRDQWPDRDAYHLTSQGNETGDPASTPAAARDADTSSSQDGDDPDADEDNGGPEGGGSGGTRPPPRPGGPRGPGGRGKKPKQRNKRRGKRIAARINLTIPLTTLLELGNAPGDAGPFGPLDGAAVRDLARTAAAHPGTRWCLSVTDPEGGAVAHGCARGPKPWAGQASRAGPGSRTDPEDSSIGLDPKELIAQYLARLGVTLDPIATTCCDHHDAEPGYTPSRRLRHKIHARTPTCSYWGCRRPAAQCDDDHTTAWERGGLTCQCNLAPLCRRHHRMKQREGWVLTQPEPGVLVWRAPSGRTYTTTPAVYLS